MKLQNGSMTRRQFVSGLAASSVALGASAATFRPDGKIWCLYQQLGYHMWRANVKDPLAKNGHFCGEKTCIDDASWERRMASCAANGANTLCIDLAEGLRYSCAPELAVEGSRSPEWMNQRVRRLRELGVQAVPMLNFSKGHDYWLGFWSRRVSTPSYYRLVENMIAEVYEIFEKPSLFNFGMDEENGEQVKKDVYALHRQGALLWHDIDFYARTISRLGARPWMSADYEWWEPKEFVKHVSKEILQTNWYYGLDFDLAKLKGIDRISLESYLRLEKAGYDQIPGCSNWLSGKLKRAGHTRNDKNIPGTVEFARANISPQHLKGIECMAWISYEEPTSKTDPTWFDAAEQLGRAKTAFYQA